MAQEQRQQEQMERYAQVVTKAWQDEGFKRRLVADPRAALQDQGLPLPHGKAMRVVEDTADTAHLVLPTKPTGGLSDEQLEQVAGGIIGFAVLGLVMLGAGIAMDSDWW
jgi:hypothetical protein